MPELENPRHELFAQNVAKGMTQEKAYIASGFWSDNEGSRRAKASQLFAKGIIAARIKELLAENAKAVQEEVIITAKEVLSELKRIGLSDVGQLYNEDGTFKSWHEIPEDIRRAIAGVEVKEEFEMENGRKVFTGYTKKLKMWDKNKALENLGRYLKLFTDKVEHSGTVNLGDRMKKADERLKNRGGKS